MMMVKASKTVTLIAVVSFAFCIGTGVLGIDVTRHEHGRNQLKTAMENTATGKNVQGTFDDDQTEMPLNMSMVDAREGNARNLTAERNYPCVDLSVHCSLWARKGHCAQNPDYMHGNCSLACRVCAPPDTLDRLENRLMRLLNMTKTLQAVPIREEAFGSGKGRKASYGAIGRKTRFELVQKINSLEKGFNELIWNDAWNELIFSELAGKIWADHNLLIWNEARR